MSKKKSKKDIEISSPQNFRIITQNVPEQKGEDALVEGEATAVFNQDESGLQDETYQRQDDFYEYEQAEEESSPTPVVPVLPPMSTKPKMSLATYLRKKEIQEKIYYKVTPELLSEVKEWENKKQQYTSAIDKLLERKTEQLKSIFKDYLEEMKPILNSLDFDESLKMNLLEREHNRLETVTQKLFGSKNASISALDELISNRKKEINMHNKITLIQSHVRGWLQRIKYKKMMHHISLRNKCALEIVETERTYVQNLSILINTFLIPLQTTKKDLLTNNEISTIFSNVTLIHGVHVELLSALDKKYKSWSNEQSLAVCFLNLTPFLKLYSQYINNFNHASTTLNECKKKDPRVKDFFFKENRGGELGSRDFLDLQIQPVQRIPRYKLLLTELLVHTPTIHKDYENIKLALKEIQNLATSINESKRDAEGFEKTILIQSSLTKDLEIIKPFRKHVKDAPIQFEKRGKLKDRHLFLFNDSLLLCKKVQGIFDSSPRYSPTSNQLMKLSGAIVLLADDPEFKNGFAVLGAEHLYFYTKTPVEQLEWFLVVKQVVADLEQSDSTLKRESSSDSAPIVRESMSFSKVSPGTLSPTNNSTNSSNNINETVTIANPRNSIKLEKSQNNNNDSHHHHQQAVVIERNSKLFENSNSNLQGSNGLRQSPPNQYSPSQSLSSSMNLVSSTNSSTSTMTPVQPPPTPSLNLSIRELMTIYNDICQLQAQLFQPSQQIEQLFGNYIKSFNLNEMNQNLQRINEILTKIINLKNRSVSLLKEEEVSNNLQNVISQGKDNIGSFNNWLKSAFPMGPNDPNSLQPRSLVINLMKWYNNLHKVWSDVLEYKPSN